MLVEFSSGPAQFCIARLGQGLHSHHVQHGSAAVIGGNNAHHVDPSSGGDVLVGIPQGQSQQGLLAAVDQGPVDSLVLSVYRTPSSS